ncbi:MAG: HAMP domain-containing protein [Bryobacterales bacterium]|nr:HAMP domain-containing protein [Bryobacterales bacterium]
MAVAAVAILISSVISETTRRAFERLDEERTRAIVAQFRREYAWRSREVIRRVEAMAASEALVRLASEMTRPGADPAPYLEQAATLAREQALEIVDIAGSDGLIISSAHYPGRFGHRKKWLGENIDWPALGAFVENEDFPGSSALALLAVRRVGAAEGGAVYIVGGQRLDKDFLDTLATPRGMRAILYRETGGRDWARSLGYEEEQVISLVERIRKLGEETSVNIASGLGPPKTVHGIPLFGRSEALLGVLLLTSIREEMWTLTWYIRLVGLIGALGGIALGVGFAWWATARITRPVQELVSAAREVAGGNWQVNVPETTRDEIGELAHAFNQMTRELGDQRGRLVQMERVAAWRELARRLAHELKNPLFPLQLTVENMQRARDRHPEQFDEVFREGTSTLLAELSQLKSIIGRFSDFAKMPSPRVERVVLSQFLPPILKLFEPQWTAPGQPPIRGRLELDDAALAVDADPDLLSRALRNLILNAMDAMPAGGAIVLRARRAGGEAVIEVSDSGAGLSREECERLFTPYYTTKQHGTGLGLAIVQSVVSDHGGKISVESEPGQGATFRLSLPAAK